MNTSTDPVSMSPLPFVEDKRRRRRQNRRGRLSPSVLPGGGFGSADGIVGQAPPESAGSAKPFNSLPNLHTGSGLMGPAPSGPRPSFSKSCPLPSASSSPARHPYRTQPPQLQTPGKRNKHFAPHLSELDANNCIEKGEAFRAFFHVNAYNRQEAYCRVGGFPVDVLISGAAAQNRAVEGDIVAIVLDPVANWTRLKGVNVPGNTANKDDFVSQHVVRDSVCETCSHIDKVDSDDEHNSCNTDMLILSRSSISSECSTASRTASVFPGSANRPVASGSCYNFQSYIAPENMNVCSSEQSQKTVALDRLLAMLNSCPSKQPTGKVISILKKSTRRATIIGFLATGQRLQEEEIEENTKEVNTVLLREMKKAIQLIPMDPKLPRMLVSFNNLPDCVMERVRNGDMTVEREVISARIEEWSEESFYPLAHVIHILGHGAELETHIAAIMVENSINATNFSSESLACVPSGPWEVHETEVKKRKDLRAICAFTIDPSSAMDLDDALSVEKISENLYRIGVHIADVTYFVIPDTALDIEAQIRSTSVYILRHKLSMLPSKLCEEVGSLNPGIDKLTISIIWDIDHSGNIISRWIGRSVIQSCCKLSYELVQTIIDGPLENNVNHTVSGNSSPQVHGQFTWCDITNSVKSLYEISRKLRQNRFKDGALRLENSKLVFLFDDNGTPCDGFIDGKMESCSIVEEFMLLANKSAAEVISRAFPNCALLRRHPEPNLKKLKELKAFCNKHGLELDASSSGHLQISLTRISEKLKNDPILFNIVVSHASKPMQLAEYFCTGEHSGTENNWAHYALAVPFYTHFTSPLRRYPDIIVHRSLLAAIDVEEMFLKRSIQAQDVEGPASCNYPVSRPFSGLHFNKDVAESEEGRAALSAAASKFKVPGSEALTSIAAYCNERHQASRNAKEAAEKVYLWALLKKTKIIFSQARVLGLGHKFMSVYISKLSIERRIYFDGVDTLSIEWLQTTGCLVLDLQRTKHVNTRGSLSRFRSIEDVALLAIPYETIVSEEENQSNSLPNSYMTSKIEPAVFPLTLNLLSSVPVAIHAVGGEDGRPDFGVRLYMSTYFT